MENFNPAPYMRWAKFRPQARYDLSSSSLMACTPEDVPGINDALPLSGLGPEGYPPLFEAIGKRYGFPSEGVALATGCSEANFLVCAAFLQAGDEVLIEQPAYDPFIGAAGLVGARVAQFERIFEENWSIDPNRVARAMTKRTRLIIISSPHNPTGVVVPLEVIRVLADLAESRNAWLLVDEVYRDATYDAPRESSAHVHSRCIVTNSLTKSYGLGGLRCGWAVGEPTVIERIRRARDAVDGVGAYPAEVAAARAFAMIDRLEARARAIIEPNLARLTTFMDAANELSWVRPDGGTVAFPRLESSANADEFVDRLLGDHETAVVPGRLFGAPAHFRIGFGLSRQTFEAGLEAIGRALGR